MDENTRKLVASNLTIAYFYFNPKIDPTLTMGYREKELEQRVIDFHKNPVECVRLGFLEVL